MATVTQKGTEEKLKASTQSHIPLSREAQSHRRGFADGEEPPPSTHSPGLPALSPALPSGCIALLQGGPSKHQVPSPGTGEEASPSQEHQQKAALLKVTNHPGSQRRAGLFKEITGERGTWIPFNMALIHWLRFPFLIQLQTVPLPPDFHEDSHQV